MANIPVGLIGCGGRGRGHVRALHELEGVELVAVCDPVAENREQVGDEYSVERRYADVEAMLERRGIGCGDRRYSGPSQRRGGSAVLGARHRHPPREAAGYEFG